METRRDSREPNRLGLGEVSAHGPHCFGTRRPSSSIAALVLMVKAAQRRLELDDIAVKFACGRCNNTWMNALEHEMAALAAWAGSPEPLMPAQVRSLKAWSLKTYLVLSAMVGETRRFAEKPGAPGRAVLTV